MAKPIVTIVGRQNVGKSTLLNRLAGRRISIVEDLPGTTRDRIMFDVDWQGREFTVIDTGGIETITKTSIARDVNDQIDEGIAAANLILFLVDARAGLLPDDIEIANRLRKTGRPVLVAANKAESNRVEAEALEFHRLGFGEPMAISAYHGRGVAELLEKIVSLLPEEKPEAADSREVIKVAIVGKPNVGKSTLLNVLIGEERVIVDDVPGTTRDAIDTQIDYEGRSLLLIDTAGIKRRGKIEAGVEKYSVIRSEEAIERADIALLVLDTSAPVAAQDTHVGGYIQQAVKGIIIVANKWDLTYSLDKAQYIKYIRGEFRFLPYAPVVFTSAKTGEGIKDVLPELIKVYQERMKRLSTSKVNDVIRQAVATHELPHKAGKRLKVLYATQADVNPPTFVFSVNEAKLVHFTYRRYLENKLRQAFGFSGTPIKLIFRSRAA
ncbi:MAG: ribosome biogenesis GTPase Der [Dehalococcoidales bacterium]|nr:ribosome biogenesis GTPase Der [Dehalococcoidales bacterium]